MIRYVNISISHVLTFPSVKTLMPTKLKLYNKSILKWINTNIQTTSLNYQATVNISLQETIQNKLI